MRGERGENGWERQRGRVRRRKGLLTECRGPWGDGWSELSGTTIHQTSRGGEKKRGEKHTPQKSELQRIPKMCSGLWKKVKKVKKGLGDLVFERVANHNRMRVVFSEWIKGPLGSNFLKIHHLHPITVQCRWSNPTEILSQRDFMMTQLPRRSIKIKLWSINSPRSSTVRGYWPCYWHTWGVSS